MSAVSDVEVLTPRKGLPVDGRRFSEKGPAGGPGCCLWCGGRLGASKARAMSAGVMDEHKAARGDYADNAFCGMRCGYQFGLQMAVFGRRLQVVRFNPPEPVDDKPAQLPRPGSASGPG